MKRQYIKDLDDGTPVETDFVVCRKELRLGRSGSMYLTLELADSTGFLPARLFEDAKETAERFSEGDHVAIRGAIKRYRGGRELVVRSLVRLDPATVDPTDFLPSSRRPVEELTGFLEFLVSETHNLHLRRLLSLFLSDEEFMAAFARAPAAKAYHHAYLGGLLEHTVSVATMCEHAAQQYERIDRDLLVSAAILHDIGKIDELEYGTKIDYTDEGRFMGHLVMGERMVAERMGGIAGFPQELGLRLRHAILSHHGELEWGSPKRPSTLEALVLHHIDNLDAKVAGFGEIVRRYAGPGVGWTDVQNLFRRPLHVPCAAENEDRVAEEADEYE
ncbi:MAG: HD domain-containing protein [Actinobacteria bacterium]|nr:MAG: HD domain-containing protein [Actinomycetota bacterium]